MFKESTIEEGKKQPFQNVLIVNMKDLFVYVFSYRLIMKKGEKNYLRGTGIQTMVKNLMSGHEYLPNISIINCLSTQPNYNSHRQKNDFAKRGVENRLKYGGKNSIL